jgi:tetratricopeptide (TPR) repeat protein
MKTSQSLGLLIFLAIRQLAEAQPSNDTVAVQLVREIRADCGGTCDYLAELAAAEARIGDVEESINSFRLAWKRAVALEDQVTRRIVLNGIGTLQASVGQVAEAVEAAQTLPAYERSMVLGSIAIIQADSGAEQAAMHTLSLIPAEEGFQRYGSQQLIASSLSNRGDFEGATRVLNGIPSDRDRAASIIATNVARDQLTLEEQGVVDAERLKAAGFAVISEDQARAGDFESAVGTALGIDLQVQRDAALTRIAAIAADFGNISVAMKALADTSNQAHKDRTLIRIVAALGREARYEMAIALADTIDDQAQRSIAFVELAAAHARLGDPSASTMMFERAIALNSSDSDATDAAALRVVHASLPKYVELAGVFAKRIQDAATLSEASQLIAVAKSQVRDLRGAELEFQNSHQAAARISDSYQKCERFMGLAVARFDSGDRRGAATSAELALAAAKEIEGGAATEVIAVTEVAKTYTKIGDRTGAKSIFEFALDAANGYSDEAYAAELLAGIAGCGCR